MTPTASTQPVPLTVLVDDVRGFKDERPALVARSSQEALELLERLRDQRIGHLWLDHDLVGSDTIRPVVDLLVELAREGAPLDVGQIHIHTANVGAGHWMGVELRAAGYAVVRSYALAMWTRVVDANSAPGAGSDQTDDDVARQERVEGKAFWRSSEHDVAMVNRLLAQAGLPVMRDPNSTTRKPAPRRVVDEG